MYELEAVRLDEVQADDAEDPDNRHDDGVAVQVLLHHGGPGQVRLDTATEEAGQATALATV